MKFVLHREVSSITCACGKVVSCEHKCDTLCENVQIVQCDEDCGICEAEMHRQSYNARRWRTDEDGYTRCGLCGVKLGEDICNTCFCAKCYDEIDECKWKGDCRSSSDEEWSSDDE